MMSEKSRVYVPFSYRVGMVCPGCGINRAEHIHEVEIQSGDWRHCNACGTDFRAGESFDYYWKMNSVIESRLRYEKNVREIRDHAKYVKSLSGMQEQRRR